MFLLKTFGLICAAYGILSVLTGCDSTVGFKSQVKSEKTVARNSAGRVPVRSSAASAPKAVSASPAANEPKAYYELDEIEEPETF